MFSRFHLNILIAVSAAMGERAFKRKLNLVRVGPDPVWLVSLEEQEHCTHRGKDLEREDDC